MPIAPRPQMAMEAGSGTEDVAMVWTPDMPYIE